MDIDGSFRLEPSVRGAGIRRLALEAGAGRLVRIEGTADYRTITERAREVVEKGSFDLIEALAEAVARECLGFDRVMRATVVVHKPNAAERLGIDSVAPGEGLTGRIFETGRSMRIGTQAEKAELGST